ncbi:MAG: hypothetical protein PHS44_07185, partial [Candidatus Dojkabacteria bacterium]|nr:hypothetical protein [Candidatus Dojkabacteria bacterium]
MDTGETFTTMANRKRIKKQLDAATSSKPNMLDKLLQSYLLIFLAIFSVGGLGFMLFREISYIAASAACPEVLQNPITGLVELDANDYAADNVIDCSAVDIEIQNGGTLRVIPRIVDNDSEDDDFGLIIQAHSFTIDQGGLLDLEGRGYGPGQQSNHIGSGKSSNTPQTCEGGSCGGSGGGHGGAGGKGDPDFEQEAGLAGDIYGEEESPITLGSGGGESARGGIGGSGGGAIKLQVSGTFTNNGSINGNGTNGLVLTDTGAGGGAGGSVWIEAANFAGEGLVTADGGNGGDASQHGGGGGGGRVVMLCTEGNTYDGIVTVAKGTGGVQDGQVGTVIGPTCYPNDPEDLRQYESNGTTLIAAGGKTKYDTVVFKFEVSDVDYPSVLRPQVEVRNQGTPFTGIATHTGSVVNYDGGAAVEAVVTAHSLPKSAPYHWRARVIDDKGARSDWVEFDEVPTEDLIILGDPYKFVMIQGNNQTGTVGQALAQKVGIEIRDISDYTIPSVAFNWKVNSGGGTIQECGCTNYYTSTDANGYSEVALVLGTVAGVNNNKIQAIKNYLVGSPMEFTATASPDEITHYDIDVPSIALVNQSFSPATVVKARDQYNNLVNTAVNEVYLDAVDPTNYEAFGEGNLFPDSSILVNGEVTVGNMTYDILRNIRVKVWDNVDEGDHNESYSDIISIVDALGDCFGRPNVPGTLTLDQSEIHNAADYPGGIINCSEVDVEIFEGTASTVITLNSFENGDMVYPSGDYGVTILANSLVVGSNAALLAEGTGYPANKGPGAGKTGSGYYPAGGGGSHGGKGGTGSNGPGSSGIPSGGDINDDVFEPVYLGSGGGEASTGAGGGAIKIVINGTNPSANSDKLIVNGEVNADGANAGGNSGGGSGGSIWVQTNYLLGSGSIHADGGFGGDGGIAGQGAGGGGGRIAIEYENMADYEGTVYAHGGGYGTSNFSKNVGGPGTVYFEKIGIENDEEGDLYVDNDGHNFLNAGVVEESCPELSPPNNGGCKFDTITLGVDMDNDGNQGYGYIDFLGTGSALTLHSSTLTGDATSDLYAYGLAYIADDPYELSLSGLHIKGDIVGYGFDIQDLNILITNQGELALYANTPWRYGNYTFDGVTINDSADLTL